MSLLAQAKLTEDNYIVLRVRAQLALLGVADTHAWTMQNIWALSARPGWGEKYAQAMAGEVTTDPAAWAGSAGADPNIITDQMIREGVHALLGMDAPAPEPTSEEQA